MRSTGTTGSPPPPHIKIAPWLNNQIFVRGDIYALWRALGGVCHLTVMTPRRLSETELHASCVVVGASAGVTVPLPKHRTQGGDSTDKLNYSIPCIIG
jgi:hypothetical protein